MPKGKLLIRINDIIWLNEIVDKLAWKHGLLPLEVEEVLRGKCRVFKRESGKVEGEDLYNALGRTKAGRYISVFFILKRGKRALIVTAREMNYREKRQYEKK